MHDGKSGAPPPRFVRRTRLQPDEARVRFCQIDREAIEVVTSAEASQVTNLMSKVYLRLVNAPGDCWERQGVLRFTGEEREGKWLTAWDQLLATTGVASATAHKALTWLHEQGVIGYDAYRNGVGIRVFINLANSSIRKTSPAPQKNLSAARTSNQVGRTSPRETPFKDQTAEREIQEINFNPHAPKNGAANADRAENVGQKPIPDRRNATVPQASHVPPAMPMQDLIRLVKAELEPLFQSAALQAASREIAQTREWFESKALPKAVRIAQKESYNVLKSYGLISTARRGAAQDVGRAAPASDDTASDVREVVPKSASEIAELADGCLALWELQGRAVDDTLAEMSVERGGWILPEDILRVREYAVQRQRVPIR